MRIRCGGPSPDDTIHRYSVLSLSLSLVCVPIKASEKSDDLHWIPVAHIMEGKSQLLQVVLLSPLLWNATATGATTTN